MSYDVDEDYDFKVDELGFRYLPESLTKRGNLYVLSNGKCLPSGTYITSDGGHLMYEPSELSPYADMLAEFAKQ